MKQLNYTNVTNLHAPLILLYTCSVNSSKSFVTWITSRIQAITTALLGWFKRSSSKFYNYKKKTFQIFSHRLWKFCYIEQNMKSKKNWIQNEHSNYKFTQSDFINNAGEDDSKFQRLKRSKISMKCLSCVQKQI